MKQSLTRSDGEWLTHHVDAVSRSFAYCIRNLREPLKQQIALAYLMFRVLDSIEDGQWDSQDSQMLAFSEFHSLVLKEEKDSATRLLTLFLHHCQGGLSQGEVNLCKDIIKLDTVFQSQPGPTRKAVNSSLEWMHLGMRWHCVNASPINFTELTQCNQYCFFVAGVIAEMLNDLITIGREKAFDREDLKNGYHLGLFLQKINILKDQIADKKNGRSFVGDRLELERSLTNHADGAMKYLINLKEAELLDYLLFAGWSFFLGLASLPSIRKAYNDSSDGKLSRPRALALFEKVRFVAKKEGPLGLEQLYLKKYRPILLDCDTKNAPTSPSFNNTLMALYTGKLTANDLQQLGC